MRNPPIPSARRPAVLPLIVAIVVVAACGSTPPSSRAPTIQPTPPPATSTPATPSEPSIAATPASSPAAAALDETWQLAKPGLVRNAAIHTDLGWVAVGNDCGGGCDSFNATGFFSSDGITWTDRPMEDGSEVDGIDVAQVGDSLFALGNRYTNRPDENSLISAVIWESTDGLTWNVISTVELGACDESCRVAQTLAASQDGVLILGTSGSVTQSASGIFRSEDGISWTEVVPAAFGTDGPPSYVAEAIGGGSGVVLAGACVGCPLNAWSSDAGVAWQALDALAGDTPQHLDMATDGTRLVLAAEACLAESCTMQLWIGPADGPLTPAATDVQVIRPRLASIGGVFVLAGMSGGLPHVFASADGVTWVEQPTNLEFSGCTIADLATSADAVVLLTDPDCAMTWVGRTKS